MKIGNESHETKFTGLFIDAGILLCQELNNTEKNTHF